jgi:FlaA1/EpsC-like NDP-sugar epimerase
VSSLGAEISKLFSGKKILVTGGTGSIGSCIVRELLKFDISEVDVFSRDEIKQFMMRKAINDKRLNFIVGDVREYKSLERAFEMNDFDIVYHAAAMKHVVVCEENPLEAVKTNIVGTQNVVDLARKYGVPKLINISTDKAVNPCNVMGATKLIGERIVLNANYTSVRFGNVAGSRGSVIPALIEEMIRKRQITITNPSVTRFVMRTSDAVKLVLKATQYAKGGEIFVLKMKAFKLQDLVDVLINYVAPKLGICSEEIKVNVTGLIHGEKLHEDLVSKLEIPYLHDLGDFYIIKPKASAKTLEKEHLIFSSDNTEFISKDELIKIVNEYINSLFYKKITRN